MASLRLPGDPNGLLAGFGGDRVTGPMMDGSGMAGVAATPPPTPGVPDHVPYFDPNANGGAGGVTPTDAGGGPMGPITIDAPGAAPPIPVGAPVAPPPAAPAAPPPPPALPPPIVASPDVKLAAPPPFEMPATPPAPSVAPSANRGLIDSTIGGLLGGDLNKDVTQRRVDSARDVYAKQRSLSSNTLEAQLAAMGQNGGSADSARVRLDQTLNSDFGDKVNQIYADEGSKADARQLGALTTGAGLSTADQDRAVTAYNAQTGRQGTLGNLALGGARLGLDTSIAGADVGLRNRGLTNDENRLGLDTNLGNRAANTADKRLSVDENLGLQDIGLRKRAADTADSRLGLDTKLGQGKLALDTTLGQGKLALDTKLGNADVGLRSRALDQGDTKNKNDFTLGQGDLGVRQRSVDVTDAANKAANTLGNRNATIDENIGNRSLDLTNQGQNLDWNKFIANLGFERDKYNGTMDASDLDRIINILGLKGKGVDTSTGGHI